MAVSVATLAVPASAAAAECAATDRPDLGFTDANCDGIDGDLADAIFVDARDGLDGNPGTRVAPLQTIAAGITAADAADKDVYIAEGTYAGGLVLKSDVSLYGGYAHGFGARLDVSKTHVVGGESGALADGATGVVLQLLTIKGGDFSGGSTSSYGLRSINGGYVLVEGAT